ncbi:hypothetical protein C8F01DRAFT_1260715 [Mycena amicta]|nr:hypothetical protein C8F01DRAFT_1260715 [Mycena amicta]
MLEIGIFVGEQRRPEIVKNFCDAPKLHGFRWMGDFDVSPMPLEQLSSSAMAHSAPEDLSNILSQFPRLSGEVELNLFRTNYDIHGLRPVSSGITSLSIGTEIEFPAAHCEEIFGAVFASLSLPNLRLLDFSSHTYPKAAIAWSHSAFLGMALRSKFSAHLQTLDMRHVALSSLVLMELLSTLHNLEAFLFADSFPSTDAYIRAHCQPPTLSEPVLAALARTDAADASHTLVPRLRKFFYASQMKFDHTLFLEFMRSRSSRLQEEPFFLKLQWLRLESEVDLHMHGHSALRSELDNIAAEHRLHFRLEASEPDLWYSNF